MKTSELINELQKLIDEHGDLEVCVFDEYITDYSPFGCVKYVDKDKPLKGTYSESFIELVSQGVL